MVGVEFATFYSQRRDALCSTTESWSHPWHNTGLPSLAETVSTARLLRIDSGYHHKMASGGGPSHHKMATSVREQRSYNVGSFQAKYLPMIEIVHFPVGALCRHKGWFSWLLLKHLLLQWGRRKPGWTLTLWKKIVGTRKHIGKHHEAHRSPVGSLL